MSHPLELVQLLSGQTFISGSDLALKLGISRNAVWKKIHYLKEAGLDIETRNSAGYRLNQVVELLDEQKIKQACHAEARSLLKDLLIFDELDSTNTYLKNMDSVADKALVCLAELQKQGRGRRERPWVSAIGSGIFCSVKWRFERGYRDLSWLSLMVGMRLCSALQNLVSPRIQLKWPNDIVIDEHGQLKKLGGVLIELSGEADGPIDAIIGFGINTSLNDQLRGDIDQPVQDLLSLNADTGARRNLIMAEICNQLLPSLGDYYQCLSEYPEQWKSYHVLAGREVSSGAITGVAGEVNKHGQLLLKTNDGDVWLDSGEVSIRMQSE
ncbi:MAG: biotin--[acetyl-CoA-carboxylase] ligase [bacterium]